MKKEKRIEVWNKYNKHCAYCGEKLEYKNMQVDHIRPQLHYEYGAKKDISKYDKDDIRNLNPSCRKCNFYKSTFSIEEFRRNIQTLIERLNKVFIVRLALSFGILKHVKWDGKFYFEKQAEQLNKTDVVGRSEQLKCDHKPKRYDKKYTSCEKCGEILQMKP